MEATILSTEDANAPPATQIGRDEMNLAEFPIALVADRAPKGQKTISFEDQHGKLTVTGSDAYGLPTAADTDVIVALIYLTKQRNDFRDVKVNFSRYELIKLLGWLDEGRSYKRLDLSFNRWGGVWLIYDKCWWNNRLKCHTSAKMHIIENVEIIDSDARRKAHLEGQNGLPLSHFTWDRKFIESCQANNLRELNLDEYFGLKSAVSKRLYRFLGKRFYRQDDCTFNLNEIAFERIGLSRGYTDAGKIKEKLQPAIEELEGIGFLRPLSPDERYRRIDRGQWEIRLTRSSPTLVAPQPPGFPPPAASPSPLAAALIARGVTRSTALELVQRHPAEAIERQIDVFDWKTAKEDKQITKSPAGYLVKSINNDYAVPKGFVTKTERERLQRDREQAEAEEAKKREAKARAEADRERQEAEEQARIEAYWQRLSPSEQAELEAASKVSDDPDVAAMRQMERDSRDSEARERWRHRRNRVYIQKLLQERGELPVLEDAC